MSISALAVSAEDYHGREYECYTFVGDSISWGYGLDPSVNTLSADLIFTRTEGAFTDIVGDVLEANCGTKVLSAASSGGRLCDYRVLLENGMGYENPYFCADDWFGNRSYERTHLLQSNGAYVVDCLKQSDLVTLQLGMNDLAGALVNALCELDFVDLDQITNLSDAESIISYLLFAVDAAYKEGKDIPTDLLSAFDRQFAQLRENGRAVLSHVVELARDDADIILLGYHDPASFLRILPDTSESVILSFIGAAMASLNDFFVDIASEYSNVYYVDIPGATVFFEDGTLLTDALSSSVFAGNSKALLLGLHPDAAGHVYIAGQVLATLNEINVCHHTNTRSITKPMMFGRSLGYIGCTVCDDCGKVMDIGKIVTPYGTIPVPSHAIDYTVDTIGDVIASVVDKIFDGIFSIFRR